MQTQQSIITIPLNHLSLSPENARKRRTPEHIAATLESLKAHGQLQNLVVTAGAQPDHYEVSAGGTRWLALQLGVERGEIAPDYPVLCRPIPAEGALEASTAENVIREDMHPADQYKAFRGMVEAGKSTTEIAAHFSVAESVVAARLKLANAAPELFALYEQGNMTLEQLQALALTDDHDAQRRAWFGQKGAKIEHDWQRRPHEIRKRITAKEVGPDSAVAKFVGTAAYEAAGGAVRRDMFSPAVYFADAALLEKLAVTKLEAIAGAERSAGWSWVDVHLELDYSDRSRYGHGPYSSRHESLSPAQAKRRATIEQRLEEIEQASFDDEQDYDTLQAEADRLNAEKDLLLASREVWSSEAKAKTGVLIYLDTHHGLQIDRGRLKPGQKLKAGKVTGGNPSGPKKPTLSHDMLARLEMQRTAAIREHIADSPDAALTLVLQVLVGQLLPGRSCSLLSIDATNQHLTDSHSRFPEVSKAPARTALEKRAAKWLPLIPKKDAELVQWLSKLTVAQRHELLAFLAALAVPVAQIRGRELATRFGVDMARWWEPNADNYVSLVSKALLAEAVTDAAGKAIGEGLLAKKKDAAMSEAAKQLAGTGWLPKPLRGEGYALNSAKAPATASKAKPTSKAPSKAAKSTRKAKPKKTAGTKGTKSTKHTEASRV